MNILQSKLFKISQELSPTKDSSKSYDLDSLSCNVDPEVKKVIQNYQETVDQIIDFVTKGDFKGKTYDSLAEMVDTIGPRMTGTKAFDESVEWTKNLLTKGGLKNVHTEQFEAPHWKRNHEELWLETPRKTKMELLGLGSSVGTPKEGITAEVVVVNTLDLTDHNATGKIVVYNQEYVNYTTTVKFRTFGATVAAKAGAVAALIRSITPKSINSPHTGNQYYSDDYTPHIPVACITIEDAEMMFRMQERGNNVTVKLIMEAENLPPVLSSNTIGEIVGSKKPEEVVVVSGHLDSWDIGQGAMDDGGGAFIALNSALVLQKMNLTAERTIRVLLFGAEEQGIFGGRDYFNRHQHSLENFQFLLESDAGTFAPEGLAYTGSVKSACIIREILDLFNHFKHLKLQYPMDGGPDINIWATAGAPTGSLLNANSEYFWYHHTKADTMTIMDRELLDQNTAFWAALSYVIADMPFKLIGLSLDD